MRVWFCGSCVLVVCCSYPSLALILLLLLSSTCSFLGCELLLSFSCSFLGLLLVFQHWGVLLLLQIDHEMPCSSPNPFWHVARNRTALYASTLYPRTQSSSAVNIFSTTLVFSGQTPPTPVSTSPSIPSLSTPAFFCTSCPLSLSCLPLLFLCPLHYPPVLFVPRRVCMCNCWVRINKS